MFEFFHGRRLRYQIQVQIEDRWEIVGVIDDEREKMSRLFDRRDHEELERRAYSKARASLMVPGVKAVKLTRERIRSDGFSTEETLLHEKAPDLPAPERLVTNFTGVAPICVTPDDFLARAACRVIGIVLRPTLDTINLTPVELLTLSGLSRSIKNADAVFNAAIHSVARQQSRQMRVLAKKRAEDLEKILARCQARLREANGLTDPPKLGTKGVDAFLETIARRIAPSDQRFWALRGLSVHISERVNFMSKLEVMAGLEASEVSAYAHELFDDLIACLLDSQDVVREVLGAQPDTRWALLRLSAFLLGSPPQASAVPEVAAQLARSMALGRLVNTREALWERLVRSVEGTNPLTHAGIEEEFSAVLQLQQQLSPVVPAALQDQVVRALQLRQIHLRREMLEKLS